MQNHWKKYDQSHFFRLTKLETHGKKRVIAQDQLDEMILFLILKDYPYNTQYLQLSIVKKKKNGHILN